MTDSQSSTSELTLAEILRQTTDAKRKEIHQAIKDHLDRVDWNYYFDNIKQDLEKSAQNGMVIGKSIVDARQEFDFADYRQSQHWNPCDAYRKNFRDRLLNILNASGFETINAYIRDGANQYRFEIIIEVSW